MQAGGGCGSQTSLSVQFASRWYWRKVENASLKVFKHKFDVVKSNPLNVIYRVRVKTLPGFRDIRKNVTTNFTLENSSLVFEYFNDRREVINNNNFVQTYYYYFLILV